MRELPCKQITCILFRQHVQLLEACACLVTEARVLLTSMMFCSAGDANFSRPTDENAVQYKKVSESFLKLPFNEFEFLRCGRESERFQILENEADITQAAQALHGVNAQCLHCLSRGCGYCFVENLLQGQEEAENPYPGEAPTPDVQISALSQCFYDPSPSGALCEQRLQTHSCRHRRPLYISDLRGCYSSETSVVHQTTDMCAASVAKELLLPPRDLSNITVDIERLRILAVDAAAGWFDAEARLTLTWLDVRLRDASKNPCGAWLQQAEADALASGRGQARLAWDAFDALDGKGFVNAINLYSLHEAGGSGTDVTGGSATVGIKRFDRESGIVSHTQLLRGTFAMPARTAAEAFPFDTHELALAVRLVGAEYSGLPPSTQLVVRSGAEARPLAGVATPQQSSLAAAGSAVGGGFVVRGSSLLQGVDWGGHPRMVAADAGVGDAVVALVHVWRGSGAAGGLVAGYLVPYFVCTAGLLLCPTHYQVCMPKEPCKHFKRVLCDSKEIYSP